MEKSVILDENVSCLSPHVVKSVILKDFEIKFVLNNERNKFSFSCPGGQLNENLYEIPTLMYSLEVLLPTKPYTCIDKLEIFLKKKNMLKQILSLPQNTPDTVPYILSGLIPVEGQLHIKALTFMYSIFLLPKESTENMIAHRQLYVKDYKSSNWFIEMKKIIWKYNLPDIYNLLDTCG